MKKNILKASAAFAAISLSLFIANIALADEGSSKVEGHELFALIHGALGLLMLLGLAAILGGLWQANEKGFYWIKGGTITLTIASIATWASGTYLYTVYKAAGGVKSDILAGSRPWVHEILMEMKEFTGAFVPIIFVVMTALVLIYGKDLINEKKARNMFVTLLALTLIWTGLTFSLGAFITKTAPI